MTPLKETDINLELDTRTAKMNLEMEAGKMLLAESQKRMAETKRKLEEEQEEREEKRQQESRDAEKRDTPELSRQSKWFSAEGKLLTEADIKWVLEMEEELWEALLNWEPTAGKELSKQLEELSRLYLALLEAILTYTMGEEQAVQTDRLNEALAQKLELLIDRTLKELVLLLEQTRQTGALKNIQANLYKQVTGVHISQRTAAFFSGTGTNTRAEGASMSMGTGQGAEERWAFSSGEGVLYKPSQGGNVQVNQEFEAYRKSEELQMGQKNAFSDQGTGRAFSAGNELVSANAFAGHLNGSGNLFIHPEITAQNEELKGLLGAVMSIKGQVYAENAGRESAISSPLRDAVDQMVNYYLTGKGAYDVYYYTTSIYERTKNPQKAMEEGLEYAYRQFLEKKENAVDGKQAAYSEQAGFFQMILQNQTPEGELRRGLRILEENWQEFIRAMGTRERQGTSSRMSRYSSWAMFLEPKELEKSHKEKKHVAELICGVILVAGCLCYYFFFR